MHQTYTSAPPSGEALTSRLSNHHLILVFSLRHDYDFVPVVLACQLPSVVSAAFVKQNRPVDLSVYILYRKLYVHYLTHYC